MKLTKHASIRTQQRGISPLVIDLLITFGARERSGNGTETCYFDNKARKRLTYYAGGIIGKLSGELDAYIVIDGETVITAGPRFKRIQNH